MNSLNTYTPDYVVHPGEILEETLEARGITKAEFARRCDISPKTVSWIVGERAPVTPEMAIQFERVLGVSSSIWNNLSSTWELAQAQIQEDRKLAKLLDWAKCFPLKEMIRREWMPKPESNVDTVNGLFTFFGIASPQAWESEFKEMQVAYRASPSFDKNPFAVAAWLRRGELLAEKIDTPPYDAQQFSSALKQVRGLTTKAPQQFEPVMKKLCAESGVAVVIEGELKGTRLSGAARWLSKDKALIQLSLRHKTNDHFWFSFFHEAAHVLKHQKKLLYLDDVKSGNTPLEEEANYIAADMLMPESEYREFVSSTASFTATAIKAFARKLGIAPGIVLGRLQHDELVPYNSRLNTVLKRRFELVED